MHHAICKDNCGAGIVDDQTLPEMIETVTYRGETLELKKRGEVYSYEFVVGGKPTRYSHTTREFVVDIAEQIRDIVLARTQKTPKTPA